MQNSRREAATAFLSSISLTRLTKDKQISKPIDVPVKFNQSVTEIELNSLQDTNQMLLRCSKFILSTNEKLNSPFLIFSIIKYEERGTRKKMNSYLSVDNLKKKKTESFVRFLEPAVRGIYNPAELDDPDLKTGKHRTVITLPCYKASIIQYARPSDLKQELNDQFRQKHPDLDASLTLSKIRNVKLLLLQIGLKQDLELSTVAKAFAFLEMLIFKNYVNKNNLDLVAAAVLMLSTKFNDRKDANYSALLQVIEKEIGFGISSKEIRDNEFAIFSALEFNLHIPVEYYTPHLDRIVYALDYNSLQDYLSGKPPPLMNPTFI